MSVPVDSRGDRDLEINTLARNLCTYTLKITSNEKNFPPEHIRFIKKIEDTVVEIHLLCWNSYQINQWKNKQRFHKKIKLLDDAYDLCERLAALIELAKPLFHLTTKRVTFWSGQVNTLEAKIEKRRENIVKRGRKNRQFTFKYT